VTISLGLVIFIVFIAAFIGFAVFAVRRGSKWAAQMAAKQEALFASMFPNLQPYYHPKNVLEFVRARLAQAPSRGGIRIKSPPGFPVDAADVSFQTDSKGREHEVWHLLDAAGQRLSSFMFESDEKDGMVRVGTGKFRVGRTEDRVRYWAPDREFKWTPPGLWKFVTPISQDPVDSDRNGMSFSDTSSSSSSRAAATAAGVAGIAAAGGAFDGGGASASWDGKSGGEGASSDSSTAGATTY
jgi:uncharacterized membrane protein YgcG